MKLTLLTLQSTNPKWFDLACSEYQEKISHYVSFEVKRIKARSLGRSDGNEKRQIESKLLLERVRPQDFVVLFDELGIPQDTRGFSKEWQRLMTKKDVVLIIGGAFGASDELKSRADAVWKLSDLTMNHLVAQLVALEQIFRAYTIWKGTPYHNE